MPTLDEVINQVLAGGGLEAQPGFDWAQLGAQIAIQKYNTDAATKIAQGNQEIDRLRLDQDRLLGKAQIAAARGDRADAAAARAQAAKLAAQENAIRLQVAEIQAAADRYASDVQKELGLKGLGLQEKQMGIELGANPADFVAYELFKRSPTVITEGAASAGAEAPVYNPNANQGYAANRAYDARLRQPEGINPRVGYAARGGSITGPALIQAGEKGWEYVYAPPGTVIAPHKKGEKPTMRGGMEAVKRQLSKAPTKAQYGWDWGKGWTGSPTSWGGYSPEATRQSGYDQAMADARVYIESVNPPGDIAAKLYEDTAKAFGMPPTSPRTPPRTGIGQLSTTPSVRARPGAGLRQFRTATGMKTARRAPSPIAAAGVPPYTGASTMVNPSHDPSARQRQGPPKVLQRPPGRRRLVQAQRGYGGYGGGAGIPWGVNPSTWRPWRPGGPWEPGGPWKPGGWEPESGWGSPSTPVTPPVVPPVPTQAEKNAELQALVSGFLGAEPTLYNPKLGGQGIFGVNVPSPGQVGRRRWGGLDPAQQAILQSFITAGIEMPGKGRVALYAPDWLQQMQQSWIPTMNTGGMQYELA